MGVKNKIFRTLVKKLFIITIGLLLVVNVSLAGFVQRDNPGDSNINYQSKIKFYLDLKTKIFLKKISVKEKMLTQMIRNIAEEMQARDTDKQILNDVEFDLVYDTGERIMLEYNSETNAIKDIIFELEKLEFVVQRQDDLKLLNELEKVKDQLMDAPGDDQFENLSDQEISQKINHYSKEISTILNIYNSIVAFQKRASNLGDEEIVKLLEQQKTQIINILEENRLAVPGIENVVQDYIKDAASIINILKQINPLKVFVENDSSAFEDVDQVQANIVAGLDERILNLIGATRQEDLSGRTITDFFKNWKSKKIAEYQLRYTKYRIFKDKLFNSSTSEERNRMLENEISDALLNFGEAEYELAGMQLKHIFYTYSYYYPNLDGVIFYQAEANYANFYYDSASKCYLTIIENFPNSKFLGQCYLRLATISYTFSEQKKFFEYYNKLDEFKDINKEDKNRVDFLAASLLTHLHRFDTANEILKNFDRKSKYFPMAQYLHGMVFTNLNEYDEAKKTYKKLVSNKRYSNADINISIIKNESLLKLGYIHYKNGEYEKALSCFTQISKGFQKYENSLINQPGSNLKNDQYDSVVNKIELLCNNFLLSNYAYEGFVLSAFCKRAQQSPREGLEDVQNVAKSKQILDPVRKYYKKRSKILQQLDELKILEERILQRQNKQLYPIAAKIQALINDALTSFRYRGAVSSRMLAEYNNGRKKVVRQIKTFDKIIKFIEEQNNREQLANAVQQGKALMIVLGEYQLKQSMSNSSYFLDNPLAPKEGAIIYRYGIVDQLFNELIIEDRSAQKNMEAIANLVQSQNKELGIELTLNLEILAEDFVDTNNHLSRFQVWLANHKIKDAETQSNGWANNNAFVFKDINFILLKEQTGKLIELTEIISKIEHVLDSKKNDLEANITRYNRELKKMQKEMEKEITRLQKIEKEKYFQEIYFETKTREIDTKSIEENEFR